MSIMKIRDIYGYTGAGRKAKRRKPAIIARLQSAVDKLGEEFRNLTGHARHHSMAGDQFTALIYFDSAMEKMRIRQKLQGWLWELNR